MIRCVGVVRFQVLSYFWSTVVRFYAMGLITKYRGVLIIHEFYGVYSFFLSEAFRLGGFVNVCIRGVLFIFDTGRCVIIFKIGG